MGTANANDLNCLKYFSYLFCISFLVGPEGNQPRLSGLKGLVCACLRGGRVSLPFSAMACSAAGYRPHCGKLDLVYQATGVRALCHQSQPPALTLFKLLSAEPNLSSVMRLQSRPGWQLRDLPAPWEPLIKSSLPTQPLGRKPACHWLALKTGWERWGREH